MRTRLQVLSEEEKNQVHERSLKILARTGVRVDTARGRQILKEAGAQVDENTRVVRFPQNLIEQALDSATKKFTLGARRPGWDLHRMCKQAHRGIASGDDKWLDDVLDQVGPGGHFLDHPTTASAVRSREWYINRLGVNASLEEWEATGRPDVMEEARETVDQILSTHRPLPLDAEIDRELDRIRKRAAESLL